MPKQEFALERGGDKRLTVAWKGIWKNLSIGLDGNTLGGFENKKSLEAGSQFTLPDGSVLHVQLVKSALSQELKLLRNGEPLPGSASDPAQRVALAVNLLFFIAGLNVALGVLAEVAKIPFLLDLGLGWGSAATGIVYALAALAVKVKRSLAALILGIGLFGLDAILTIVLPAQGSGQPNTGGLVARFFLMIPLVRAVPALRQLIRAGKK